MTITITTKRNINLILMDVIFHFIKLIKLVLKNALSIYSVIRKLIFSFNKMNYGNAITEKQNKLDQHMYIYQEFVNDFNLSEDTNDTYRQQIITNIDNLDSALFSSYKSLMELKASKDFGIQPETNINRGSGNIPSHNQPIRSEGKF